jgi:hypothetical protein
VDLKEHKGNLAKLLLKYYKVYWFKILSDYHANDNNLLHFKWAPNFLFVKIFYIFATNNVHSRMWVT